MKRQLTLVLLALLAIAPAWSQLLWQVDGNGLTKPSYIVGTQHFAPPSTINDIKGLNKAIEDVDAVWGEIHADSLISPNAQLLMAKAVIAPADSTLNMVLSQADYACVDTIVRKYMGAMGISSLDQLAMLKPAGLAVQLQAIQAQMFSPDFNPSAQLDNLVQTMGRNAGKEIGGFETVGDQINVLFATPITEQAKALVEMCRHDADYREATQMLINAYTAQDLDALYKLLVDPELGAKPTPEELDRLVWSRNHKWTKKMQELMPTKSLLVCVGAGHLPGDKGLIELLRQVGYTVTPCK